MLKAQSSRAVHTRRSWAIAPLLAACASGPVFASDDFGSASLVTDSDYRGLSLSARRPALVCEYYKDVRGVYVGIWGTSTNGGPERAGNLEFDLIAFLEMGEKDRGLFEVGAERYNYPGLTSQDASEAWISWSRAWVSGAFHYSPDWSEGKPAYYLEENLSIPLDGESTLLGVHFGRSFGPAWQENGLRAYSDYGVSLSRSYGRYGAALKFVGTHGAPVDGRYFSAASRVVFTLSIRLP